MINGMTLEELSALARAFAESKLFPDALTPSRCLTKILAGAELGFPPVASMRGMRFIEGQLAPSAAMQSAAIKRSDKYDYRIAEHTGEKCRLEFIDRKTGAVIGESIYTMEDAKRAGLAGGTNYRQHPRNMLFARALTNGGRWLLPDLFGGAAYLPEELDRIESGQNDSTDAESSSSSPARDERIQEIADAFNGTLVEQLPDGPAPIEKSPQVRAAEFIDQYRQKGYPDDKIRMIAETRPEPLRSAVLAALCADVKNPANTPPESATASAPDGRPDLEELSALMAQFGLGDAQTKAWCRHFKVSKLVDLTPEQVRAIIAKARAKFQSATEPERGLNRKGG